MFTHALSLFLRFILLVSLTTSVARSAILIRPSPISTNKTLPYSLRKPSELRSRTRCILEVIPPVLPVDRNICAPAFSNLLRRPDVDEVREYARQASWPASFSRAPCVIGMDRRFEGTGTLRISFRQIVMIASRTLVLCERYGQGGWEHIDGDEDWVVFVEGA